MNYYFDQESADKYKSHSQAARVLTENWVLSNMYCIRCGNPKLIHFPNNSKVADFYCPECKNEYELKARKGNIGRKILGGAYYACMQRITSANSPDLLVMTYDPFNLCIEDLWVIPKQFLTTDIIEKRKPLSSGARRAGWVGCNILFDKIPQQGRIRVIQGRIEVEKDEVLANVSRVSCLATSSPGTCGWLHSILDCINRIPKEVFSLGEVYQFDQELQKRYPRNNNVRPKIRQKLQVLRDKGYLEFLDRGLYRKRIDRGLA